MAPAANALFQPRKAQRSSTRSNGETNLKHHQRWKVELHGHLFDLKDVAGAAPGVGAEIFQEGDRWFLQAASFKTLANYAEVYDAAERVLGDLHKVANAAYGNTEPIAIGGIFDQHTEGTPTRS
jgi:hypothetical protein